MKSPVLTKLDFVKRYSIGEFGNASPTWNDYFEWALGNGSKYGELFHIRNRITGGPTWYNVHHSLLYRAWYDVCSRFDSSQLYISVMAPTAKTLIQGEVMLAPWGLYLLYTTVRLPMRNALAKWCRSVQGVQAETILRDYLNPRSYDWLMYLLNEYQDRSVCDPSIVQSTPTHVVEFSTYSCEWGTVPGHNTVFWEIRKY